MQLDEVAREFLKLVPLALTHRVDEHQPPRCQLPVLQTQREEAAVLGLGAAARP